MAKCYEGLWSSFYLNRLIKIMSTTSWSKEIYFKRYLLNSERLSLVVTVDFCVTFICTRLTKHCPKERARRTLTLKMLLRQKAKAKPKLRRRPARLLRKSKQRIAQSSLEIWNHLKDTGVLFTSFFRLWKNSLEKLQFSQSSKSMSCAKNLKFKLGTYG